MSHSLEFLVRDWMVLLLLNPWQGNTPWEEPVTEEVAYFKAVQKPKRAEEERLESKYSLHGNSPQWPHFLPLGATS